LNQLFGKPLIGKTTMLPSPNKQNWFQKTFLPIRTENHGMDGMIAALKKAGYE